jgi:hypothetical protein
MRAALCKSVRQLRGGSVELSGGVIEGAIRRSYWSSEYVVSHGCSLRKVRESAGDDDQAGPGSSQFGVCLRGLRQCRGRSEKGDA